MSVPDMLDRCRRTLCGHMQMQHAPWDDESQWVGIGNGWCMACDNLDRCASFVGSSAVRHDSARSPRGTHASDIEIGDDTALVRGLGAEPETPADR